MSQADGVIKFDLVFKPAPAINDLTMEELNYWRTKLYEAGLIGQDPHRYEGFGFGNVSCRLSPFESSPHHRRFLITGTQTGGLATLAPEHYVCVTDCDPQANRIIAEGPIRPSSEALTHGMIYDLDESIRCVMHVHSPDIWGQAASLNLPQTSREAPYGTPQMAYEVEQLFKAGVLKDLPLFVMGGHQDGVVSFGRTAEEAGTWLLQTWSQARVR